MRGLTFSYRRIDGTPAMGTEPLIKNMEDARERVVRAVVGGQRGGEDDAVENFSREAPTARKRCSYRKRGVLRHGIDVERGFELHRWELAA